MKIFLYSAVSLMLGLAIPVFGQENTSPSQEVTVYLKNGNVIHGYETLSPFKGYLTLDIDAFTQQHIPYKKIEHVHYGPPLVQPPVMKWGYDQTFFLSVAAGIQFGSTESGNNRAAASFFAGYIFHPKLQPGIGVSVEQYDPILTTTFFARVQGLLTNKPWSPYYFLEAGGSSANTRNWDYSLQYHSARGGFMLHPGLGIQRTFRNGAIFFGLGYRIQQAKLDYSVNDYWGGTLRVQEQLTYRRLSTMIGLTF
ncbi:MAG: hypothetical protein RIG62_31090 [Cyclobacteriaceae bacterium]